MLSVTLLLLVAAFIACIVSALGKCPIWVSVLLLCIVGLIVDYAVAVSDIIIAWKVLSNLATIRSSYI